MGRVPQSHRLPGEHGSLTEGVTERRHGLADITVFEGIEDSFFFFHDIR